MKIIDRRHPEYDTNLPIWDFYYDSYQGGEQYFKKYLFRYYKEGENEYKDRQQRAYRQNHVKKIINLYNSYLFQEPPVRKTESSVLGEWFGDVTGAGDSMTDFMGKVSLYSYIMGRIYIVMDKPILSQDNVTNTQMDTIKAKPYVYTLMPQDVLDLRFDTNGNIDWILLVEHKRDDEDPFTSSGEQYAQYRLWTKEEWFLFNVDGDEIEKGTHNLGIVPVIPIDSTKNNKLYTSPSLVEDIVYLDRAIFNNWSKLDTIINDQTFSQLIIPVDGIILTEEDEELKQQFIAMGTKRIFLYNASAGQPPQFISPDASQAQLILDTIREQVVQLYQSAGLQNEMGVQTTTQSGVSKAYDFDKINKILSEKADILELIERKIIYLWSKWNNIPNVDFYIDYPEEFDVKSLAEELSLSATMFNLDISKTYNIELKKTLVQKTMPKISKEKYDIIAKEIEVQESEPDNGEQTFPFDKNA